MDFKVAGIEKIFKFFGNLLMKTIQKRSWINLYDISLMQISMRMFLLDKFSIFNTTSLSKRSRVSRRKSSSRGNFSLLEIIIFMIFFAWAFYSSSDCRILRKLYSGKVFRFITVFLISSYASLISCSISSGCSICFCSFYSYGCA